MTTDDLQPGRDFMESAVAGCTRPRIAIIAGSGLSGLADLIEPERTIPYEDIPAMAGGRVVGHDYRWLIGRREETGVHLLLGRRHMYEGISARETAYPVRLLASLGVRLVIVTNAAGGLTSDIRPGDLMLIADMINLQFRNPLMGPNDDATGPRFPDMSEPFDRAAAATIARAAREAKIELKEGVYAGVLGPNYETRAEVNFLRRIGADVVGMSTVAEVVAARHAGARVVGLSLVTNSHVHGTTQQGGRTTHDEVLEMGRRGQAKLVELLGESLPELGRLVESPLYRAK